MREIDRVLSRRAFLKRAAITTAGVSAALIVGDQVFDALERMFPRRLFAGTEFLSGRAQLILLEQGLKGAWDAPVVEGPPFRWSTLVGAEAALRRVDSRLQVRFG